MRKEKLVIGIIQQSPDIGGAETYMKSLVQIFRAHDHCVFVITNKGNYANYLRQNHIIPYSYIPYYLDMMGNVRGVIKSILLLPFAIVYYIRLMFALKKEGCNIILLSNFSEKIVVTLLSQFFNMPVVWIEYGRLEAVFSRIFHIPKFLYLLAKGIPHAIIVPSKHTYESLIEFARVSKKTLHTIPCGIVKIAEMTKNDRRLPTIPKESIVFGNVSRLTKEKGQDVLIKAFAVVHTKEPNIKLLLVGEGPDRAYYESLVKEYQIKNCVTITGFVKDVEKYYAQMDVFVFPTVWELEGFGLVLLEAMRAKLPIIATSIGPVPEIIQDGINGLLVPPGAVDMLVEKMKMMIKNDRLRKKLAVQGHDRFTQKYTLEQVSQQIERIFYTILKEEKSIQ